LDTIQDFCSLCNKYSIRNDDGDWLVFKNKPVFIPETSSWFGDAEGVIPQGFFKPFNQTKLIVEPIL
jgi:hypothetical protein